MKSKDRNLLGILDLMAKMIKDLHNTPHLDDQEELESKIDHLRCQIETGVDD